MFQRSPTPRSAWNRIASSNENSRLWSSISDGSIAAPGAVKARLRATRQPRQVDWISWNTSEKKEFLPVCVFPKKWVEKIQESNTYDSMVLFPKKMSQPISQVGNSASWYCQGTWKWVRLTVLDESTCFERKTPAELKGCRTQSTSKHGTWLVKLMDIEILGILKAANAKHHGSVTHLFS